MTLSAPTRLAALAANLMLALPPLAPAQTTQDAPAGPRQWEAEIRQYEIADREHPPPKGGVVFAGSSSIRLWESLERDFPGVQLLNRGFGGSELADLAYFADRIVTPYAPRMVVVYAGDNDIANGQSPRQVLASYTRLVSRVHARLPRTKIAFISIKPSLARWNLVDQVREANALVKRRAAKDPRLLYIDVFTPMLDDDGQPRRELFVEDGLHMSAEGYALWTSKVTPILHAPTHR